MPSRRARAPIPKLEGFERPKYQNIATAGLTARVYAAFFGKPMRIIDVYNVLYCRGKNKPPSTGRISHSALQLLEAGYLDKYKIESSNWPLLSANLQPLYGEFESKGIAMRGEDKQLLESALIPDHDSSARFAITGEEATGREEFIPSIQKIKTHLNSCISMALLALAKQQQPAFAEERKLLERIKRKAYGASQLQEEKQGDLSSFDNFSPELAIRTQAAIKGGVHPRDILFFKLLHLLHEKEEAKKIEEELLSLFE